MDPNLSVLFELCIGLMTANGVYSEVVPAIVC